MLENLCPHSSIADGSSVRSVEELPKATLSVLHE